jgi:tungstate transport system ATP-binding protein
VKPIFELERVARSYNGRTVVSIDHLQIIRNEVLAVVGPSGAGKSTLLRLLAFLERPDKGRIVYSGRECNPNWPDLAARRKVTLVFQRPLLLRGTVSENVAYGLNIRGTSNGLEQITPILDRLGLSSLADVPAHTLSGGEMQRVALARAMVLEPDVLLLDEPTANLDPYNIKLIERMVADANRRNGMTLVIVTHNIFQARRLASRVGLMLSGRLVEVADTETFFERSQRTETIRFVRGEMIY